MNLRQIMKGSLIAGLLSLGFTSQASVISHTFEFGASQNIPLDSLSITINADTDKADDAIFTQWYWEAFTDNTIESIDILGSALGNTYDFSFEESVIDDYVISAVNPSMTGMGDEANGFVDAFFEVSVLIPELDLDVTAAFSFFVDGVDNIFTLFAIDNATDEILAEEDLNLISSSVVVDVQEVSAPALSIFGSLALLMFVARNKMTLR